MSSLIQRPLYRLRRMTPSQNVGNCGKQIGMVKCNTTSKKMKGKNE